MIIHGIREIVHHKLLLIDVNVRQVTCGTRVNLDSGATFEVINNFPGRHPDRNAKV